MPSLSPIQQVRALIEDDVSSGFLQGMSDEQRCLALAYVMENRGVGVGMLMTTLHFKSPSLQANGIISKSANCFALELYEDGSRPIFISAHGENTHIEAEDGLMSRMGGPGVLLAAPDSKNVWMSRPIVPMEQYSGRFNDQVDRSTMLRAVAHGQAILEAALLFAQSGVSHPSRPSPRL